MPIYWYGGSGNINDFTNHLSLNSGNSPAAPLGRVLNNTDDLIFDANSNTSATNYTVTFNVNATVRDLTVGFTGTAKVILAGSVRVAVYGNLDFIGGTAQVTNTSSLAFDFYPPNGTTKTIMSRGVSFTGQVVKQNTTGIIQLLDPMFFANGYTILNGGALWDTNGFKVTATNVNSFGTSTDMSFDDLEITIGNNAAVYFSMFSLGNQTVTIRGTLTLNGYSNKVRLRVAGDYRYVKTLNAANVVASNVDFQELVFGGAANWDFSAQPAIGDCGGNSANFYGTTPTNVTMTNTASCTWESNGVFSPRYPLPQDNVSVVGAYIANQQINIGTARVCKNIDFSTCTGTPRVFFSTYNTNEFFGSINITGITPTGTNWIQLSGRGNNTITSGGKTFTQTVSIKSVGGTYSIADDFNSTSVTSWGALSLSVGNLVLNANVTLAGKLIKNYSGTAGNITDNGYTIICARANLLSSGGGVMTGKLIVTGISSAVSDAESVFCIGTSTMDLTNYTIEVSDATTAVKALNLQNTSKIGKIELTGAGTMNFYSNAGVIGELKLPINAILILVSSKTFTVTTFTPAGAYTILSSSATTAATLAKAGGGRVVTDYGTFTKITGSPIHVWFAGSHGVDGGGNTYIYFYDVPPNRGEFFNLMA
jgi:hypothetical protein